MEKKKKVSYPLAQHITKKKPHPTAINTSAALSQMFVQTRTQQRAHNNTPFLCTTGLVSGNTGERRYLSSSLGVGGQQRPHVSVLVTFVRALGVFYSVRAKASSANKDDGNAQ